MKTRIRKLLFLFLFIVIGFILLQIPFTNIIGSNQKFSLFDFFAPTTGMFLNSFWGAISVVMVKFFSVVLSGQNFDTVTIVRFFPLALGAFYFGARKYQKLVAFIPVICMIMFILHPEGKGAWFYSLYWLIPLASVFVKKSLIFRSLGATFTSHAVGSIAFLYAFNLPTEVWIGLIPIVFLERMLFTFGTAISFIVLNTLVDRLAKRFSVSALQKLVQPEYTFSKKLLSHF